MCGVKNNISFACSETKKATVVVKINEEIIRIRTEIFLGWYGKGQRQILKLNPGELSERNVRPVPKISQNNNSKICTYRKQSRFVG